MTSYAPLARAEWIKMRSLRSTGWTLFAMVASSLALSAILAVVVDAHWSSATATERAQWDPTNQSLVGTLTGQIAIGVLGVLAITAEYASGTIRSSIAAVPRRTPLTVAKVAVYGGVAMLVGELISFTSFAMCQAIFSGHVPSASLGGPGVLRAVSLTGVYCGLVCLMALGLGLILRHTAGAISAVVGIFLVVPGVVGSLPGQLSTTIGRFLPEQLAANSMAAVVPEAHALSAVVATALMVGYTAGFLIVGNQLLKRRDV